jgi:hypothetical protein
MPRHCEAIITTFNCTELRVAYRMVRLCSQYLTVIFTGRAGFLNALRSLLLGSTELERDRVPLRGNQHQMIVEATFSKVNPS